MIHERDGIMNEEVKYKVWAFDGYVVDLEGFRSHDGERKGLGKKKGLD